MEFMLKEERISLITVSESADVLIFTNGTIRSIFSKARYSALSVGRARSSIRECFSVNIECSKRKQTYFGSAEPYRRGIAIAKIKINKIDFFRNPKEVFRNSIIEYISTKTYFIIIPFIVCIATYLLKKNFMLFFSSVC
jgi:hypothetical protein